MNRSLSALGPDEYGATRDYLELFVKYDLECSNDYCSESNYSFLFQLPQGTFLQVPPSLVKRCKTHYHNMPCGATVILGNNGYIWIGPVMANESDLSLRGPERQREVSPLSSQSFYGVAPLVLDSVSSLIC